MDGTAWSTNSLARLSRQENRQERHRRAGAVEHGAPHARLREVGDCLEHESEQQPRRACLVEQDDERLFFGHVHRDEHDGGDRRRAEQPRQPASSASCGHGDQARPGIGNAGPMPVVCARRGATA
jgi:hypothetical protein